MNSNRQLYIDNLRIFLISLVVLHHTAITYGAPGGWYYAEGQAGLIASLFLTMFVATNQSFFMGLLFFISAYFADISLANRGGKSFLSSRFKRLGIPLLLFYFILSPFTRYLPLRFSGNVDISFVEYIQSGRGFGFGPMWFVEILLIFALLYVLIRAIKKSNVKDETPQKIPHDLIIFLFASGLGLITFLVRLRFPVGWSLAPFGFQLAHFPQYIAMLVVGVIAYKRNWFASLDIKKSLRYFLFAQVMIFIIFPAIFLLGGASSGSAEPFMGGWTIQSFTYSLWEQFNGLALMIGVLGIFKHIFSRQNRFGSALSQCSYAVYVFHAPIVVGVTLSVKSVELPMLLKFVIFAIPVLAACFAFAYFIKKLLLVRKVL